MNRAQRQLMVLWRELKRMNQRFFSRDCYCVFFWLQAADRFGVFDKFLGRHSTSFKIPPPSRPRFAPVILQKLPRKPTVISGLGALQKVFAQALTCIESFCRLLRNFTWLRKLEPSEFARAQLMQPIEQRQRGPAVLLVISGDLAEKLIILAFAPVLIIDNRLHAGPDGSGARELEKRFQFLERVTRHTRPQGLTKNAVEIDEYFSPEKIVNLGLSCRV